MSKKGGLYVTRNGLAHPLNAEAGESDYKSEGIWTASGVKTKQMLTCRRKRGFREGMESGRPRQSRGVVEEILAPERGGVRDGAGTLFEDWGARAKAGRSQTERENKVFHRERGSAGSAGTRHGQDKIRAGSSDRSGFWNTLPGKENIRTEHIPFSGNGSVEWEIRWSKANLRKQQPKRGGKGV